MFSALFFFIVASSMDLSNIQEFCQLQGWGDCFAVTNIHADQETIVVDNRDPISIIQPQMMPISLLGEEGWELAFQTAWGSGVLIQMPDEESFTGEIPLEGDVVLHIFPCPDSEECTSFGYELYEDPSIILDSDSDEMEEEPSAGGERRRSLNSKSEAFISRVKSLSKSDSVARSATSRLPGTAHTDALRRSLDSTFHDCEELSTPIGFAWSWASGMQYNYHSMTSCTVTVRMVFALPSLGGSIWRSVMRSSAALIVGEFNEAMITSVNSADQIFQMKLEHVDFIGYNFAQDPMDQCWNYKQGHDDSDLTHCIFPDSVMGPYVGRATWPWSSQPGVSWVKVNTLPGNFYSGRHTSVHEIGHNLNARHVTNGNSNGASIMIQGEEPGANNRLLRFSPSAVAYHGNIMRTINNVDLVRNQLPVFANEK